MNVFLHWDMKMFFQTNAALFYYGMHESDYLQLPENYDTSAAGLYLLRY